MVAWFLIGLTAFALMGFLADAMRCPTRHWVGGRCKRWSGHRGDHLARGYVWSTRRLSRRWSR